MSNSGRDARPRRIVVPDPAVSHYETLPLDEVREELKIAGIDPAPTIAAVKKLVEDSLAKSKQPHPEPTKSQSRAAASPLHRSSVAAVHSDARHDEGF
jgi:hypothetical protein